ncbi:hypothetical protein EMCG_08567 [[Emmonsia] crescens]|uniref:Uncharacterized protein n=1 Tax=[Emmonsia] crescens TaxID=73230 RepID=A0A0G2I581_9EURO|nr:hypothetical protein EMCG_08567 [Emmonsia crescens UAMH 3008]
MKTLRPISLVYSGASNKTTSPTTTAERWRGSSSKKTWTSMSGTPSLVLLTPPHESPLLPAPYHQSSRRPGCATPAVSSILQNIEGTLTLC